MGGTNPMNITHLVAGNILWAIQVEGPSLWLLFTGIMAVLLAASVYVSSRHRRRLPPGPRGWPLVGNALDMPRQKEWLTFTEWQRTYGNIVSLSMAGQTIIILNSVKAAIDLLQKRSSIYSDRPRLVMSGELVGFDQTLVLARYGNTFRQMRRLTHQVFSARPAEKFWPVQQRESVKFLNRLLQTPDQFIHHIRHTAGAIILKISHGYTVSESDPFVALAGKTLQSFSLSTTPGAFWVDFLPWLEYVPSWCPGAGFHRTASKWRKDLYEMTDSAHSFTKDQMAKGVAVPSFTSELLDSPYTPETEYLVKWTAGSMYGGGVDTTVSAITTFFLAMCTYPEVQVTAQAELDSVVGRDRLPTMADRPFLPYINAILKEVLRWGPVTPLLLHRLIQDDEYEGYRIPAGSIVMPNIWAMTRDADLYPDPSEFRPDRFMMPNTVGQEADPIQFLFGFGRRICPGQHLADASLFFSIAMTLAMFKISKAHDPVSGAIIEPVVEWLPGSISHPKPFPCEIMPRSTQAVDIIQQAIRADGDHGTHATNDGISL